MVIRTKGGMNTKLHAVTDTIGRPIRFFMTAGQVSDYIGARALVSNLPAAEWLLGDRGYDADWFREALVTMEWKMRQTSGTRKSPGEKIVKEIKRATRKQYSSEEKIRIVLDGLRGEDSIAELCRREGISQGVYYKWSKDFMEAGKKRLSGDTARAATTDEVKDLRREARDLKEVVAEQTLELRILKKNMLEGGGDQE